MRFWSFAPLVGRSVARSASPADRLLADQGMRISGPHVHENLAVYFVHGVSVGGAVPLTLQEALAKGSVKVIETGNVNELQIENTGSEEVFIQAGDIVKGGKQDRVLTVSFVLPPKSGRVPIASFCVEQGRWSARGKEDRSSSRARSEAMPSRAGLLAMATPTDRPKWQSRRKMPKPAVSRWRPARSAAMTLPRSSARSGIRSPLRKASYRAASTRSQRAAVGHQPAAHAGA